ncbi:MAG TPA: hypothetical protein DCM62_06440 [Bacteroidales bacterium]|nr:hypothetical protein [Bacteroidales bacterium]
MKQSIHKNLAIANCKLAYSDHNNFYKFGSNQPTHYHYTSSENGLLFSLNFASQSQKFSCTCA